MSGFGGSPFGGGNGGGGGGRSNSSWGGGRSGGRSGGRGRSSGRGRSGGRGRGGRNSYNSNNRNADAPTGLLKLCEFYTKSNSCNHSGNCRYGHVIQLQAKIRVSENSNNGRYNNSYNNNNNNNNNQSDTVTSVAIWETGGNVKIFTGGKDGFWKLWSFNAQANSFVKEFEHQMGSSVESLVVASNFLFCGFEGVSKALPEVGVGMVHAWNLASPNDPPLEFHMQPNLIPYAHSMAVKKLLVVEGQKIISGSEDGSIKMWTFEPPSAANPKGAFVLTQNIVGHARGITGLVDVGSMLWSCSTDGSIRLWDMSKPGAPCQHFISMSMPATGANNAGPGHTNAVTGLTKFTSASGEFVLSCSLDGTVKAWNGSNGECVASENHGEGVVTMTMSSDPNGKPFLLLGMESGSMYIRNLEPTPKIPQAFSAIAVLDQQRGSHQGAVRTMCQGPAGTFYSGADDGNVLVYQITGDLGL